jgi:chromosome segregation ATPase
MRTRLLAFALLLFAAAAGVLTAGDKSMSYIYRRGDSSYARISGEIGQIGAMAKRYGGEFVWVRWNGRSYVIRDAATLAEVRSAFREVEAMEPSLREIERRLQPFEQQMEAIEKRVDAFSDQLGDEDLGESTRNAIEAKLRDAEEAMRAVERQMEGVEREMERLEKEVDQREEAAERRFERIVKRAIESGVAENAD